MTLQLFYGVEMDSPTEAGLRGLGKRPGPQTATIRGRPFVARRDEDKDRQSLCHRQ